MKNITILETNGNNDSICEVTVAAHNADDVLNIETSIPHRWSKQVNERKSNVDNEWLKNDWSVTRRLSLVLEVSSPWRICNIFIYEYIKVQLNILIFSCC